jgi:flavin-dependent dehydrogenase
MFENIDVLVIGAGPAGTVASTLLSQKGYKVTILEKANFPRFFIGESLLPQCMDELEKVGMLEAVRTHGFQHKNGAAFRYRDRYESFNFGENYSKGWNYTYQVQRADFDTILAKEAEKAGAEIYYGHEITAVDFSTDSPLLNCRTQYGKSCQIQARFVLDGSGSTKVLPRLLNLEIPSELPPRSSVFTHVIDNIQNQNYDREKILITIHPQRRDIWYWLIPFSNGTASIGVVGEAAFIDSFSGTPLEKLQAIMKEDSTLSELLNNAVYDFPVSRIDGYSSNVKTLYGKNYALLGNAGEFLDPVFSSGITLALKSASLAIPVVDKQLKGENVNWEDEFAKPLMQGVDTFREFVNAWYDGNLQNIIFSDTKAPQIKAMICSVLAGYAWDTNNPCVKEPQRRLKSLSEVCKSI